MLVRTILALSFLVQPLTVDPRTLVPDGETTPLEKGAVVGLIKDGELLLTSHGFVR